MYFSVVVLVLTKALFTGKFTLFTAIESSKRVNKQVKKKWNMPKVVMSKLFFIKRHDEIVHFEYVLELWHEIMLNTLKQTSILQPTKGCKFIDHF